MLTDTLNLFTLCHTECPENFAGGLYWEVAFEGDTVTQPCRDIDSIFRYINITYSATSVR